MSHRFSLEVRHSSQVGKLRTAIQGGFFSDDPHRYEDEAGNFVPSMHSDFKLTGISDYSAVDSDVLDADRRARDKSA